MEIKDNQVFLAQVDGFKIVDVSNPTNCYTLGNYAMSNGANDFSISSNLVYIAKTGGVEVLNIRDPAHIVSVGSFTTMNGANGIAVSGHYAYVAGHSYTPYQRRLYANLRYQ